MRKITLWTTRKYINQQGLALRNFLTELCATATTKYTYLINLSKKRCCSKTCAHLCCESALIRLVAHQWRRVVKFRGLNMKFLKGALFCIANFPTKFYSKMVTQALWPPLEAHNLSCSNFLGRSIEKDSAKQNKSTFTRFRKLCWQKQLNSQNL